MNEQEEKAKESLTLLYDTHADSVFRFCYFKTGNREVAKDLTQDIFVKVFNYLVKEELQNAKTFIFTIAKNTIIDFWRKSKSIPESHLPEGFFESIEDEDHSDAKGDYGVFLTLINKLSESDREVIVLRYIEDMSSKDMASMLGERENTVLVRISRARERLRNLLKEMDNKNI